MQHRSESKDKSRTTERTFRKDGARNSKDLQPRVMKGEKEEEKEEKEGEEVTIKEEAKANREERRISDGGISLYVSADRVTEMKRASKTETHLYQRSRERKRNEKENERTRPAVRDKVKE